MHSPVRRIEQIPVATYNATLLEPTVRAAIHHFVRHGVHFDSAEFIWQLSQLPRFPAISVGELLSAARIAGVMLTGAHATLDELHEVPTPFLTFLKTAPQPNARLELVQVESIRRRHVALSGGRFGDITMPLDMLMQRWSGIVLMTDSHAEHLHNQELRDYRSSVDVLQGILTPEECRELLSYCEEVGFRRSKVLQRRDDQVSDVIQARVRSSSSAMLTDRSHPLLSRIYSLCADFERVSERDIEAIQCVRYKQGQRFRPHFDGGLELPRRTTYLLYLNDNFDGGDTYFPLLDLAVAPMAGACLRFPSCDREGRILWPSEHGGLPVKTGVKYALNIWVRTPSIPPRPILAPTAGPGGERKPG